MMKRDPTLAVVALSLVAAGVSLATVGARVDLDLLLPGKAGAKATVVAFLGVGCPVANTYAPRLNQIAMKYATREVKVVGVNSNLQDSAAAVAKHAKEYELCFEVIKDEKHRLADAIRAERTPEAVLLDAKGVIRYQGRIDDQYGVTGRRPQPTRNDLQIAIDELLAGKSVSVSTTAVEGCIIGREPKP